MAGLRALVYSEPVNALVGWALAGAVGVVALGSALAGDLLWAGVALAAAAVVAAPAAATGDWRLMVPWPPVLVLAAAVVVRALGRYPEASAAVAVASLALVAVLELDAFTAVDMSRRFAVAFAVMTTLALQGLWTVAQFYADRWLGTDFLTSQVELQWDIAIVATVAVAMGAVFELYVQRVDHVGSYRRPIRGP